MPMKIPVTYRITKVENTVPKGVNMFTIYQDEFNQHTDFVCLEDNNPDFKFGEMYADYWTNGIENKVPVVEKEPVHKDNNTLLLKCAKTTIKVGGSYKTITAQIINDQGEDVTSEYSDAINWKWEIDENDTDDLVKTLISDESNIVFKIKLAEKIDESYIGKKLKVKCNSDTLEEEIILDIVAL